MSTTRGKPDHQSPFSDITDFRVVMEELEIAEPRKMAVPHLWNWDYIRKSLTESDRLDLTEVHRRAFALCNPGLGGRPLAATTLFAAVSVYYPGDKAPVHRHTPSASRFALEGSGGYTNVAGEKLEMGRGDLVITPNGEWHDHGNDGDEPIFWVDVLDAPLIESLNAIMTDWDYVEPPDGSNTHEPIEKTEQSVSRPADYSQSLFSASGIVPRFGGTGRMGRRFTPKYMYRAEEVRRAQSLLRDERGDPYEGIIVEYTDPMSGEPVVPTLSFRSQLIRSGEVLGWKRQTASTVYCVLEGQGATEFDDRRFEWGPNDVFVIPGWSWRRHINGDPANDAVLYSVSDAPAQEKLGVFRAQGRDESGTVTDISRWPDFD